MNRRNYFFISINILLLIALGNIPALNAVTYERGWNVGTAVDYTIKSLERESLEATNDTNFMTFELELQASMSMNITEIDELINEAIVERTLVGSSPDILILDFDAENSSNELAEYLFFFYFYWDYNFNRAILTSFDIGMSSFIPFIVEPDWTVFNENFAKILDENQTIATIDTGYEIQIILLSDFLDQVSFNINGKDNLLEAKNSFTPDTTKWTLEFDVSDYILDPEYNYDEAIYEYFEYDKYEVKFELEYTKDGILSEMKISKLTWITKDNVKYIYEENYSVIEGDIGTASISYNLYSTLIVLVILPMLLSIRKKKKSDQ